MDSVPQMGRFPGEGNGKVFLPEKSHRQRSLSGPWGCKRVGHNLATKQEQHIKSK